MKKRIMVIDNELPALRQLQRLLIPEGYEDFPFQEGRKALAFLTEHNVDLVLLDMLMPGMNGQQVCEEIRAFHPSLPIIIVSVKTDIAGKVRALDAGADDYIAKPFDETEVLSRIRVQLRHREQANAASKKTVFTDGTLEVNLEERSVKVNGKRVDLTTIEYDLLHVLIQHADKTVTYNFISSQVWHADEAYVRKVIHVFINHLRNKIEEPAGRRYIINEQKIGYRFQTKYDE